MTNEPAVRFFRATIAYDGGAYYGWQWQPGKQTVQAEIEKALRKITGRVVRIMASGRTDAGVHAIGQVISFAVATRLDPDTIRQALDASVPFDITVRDVAYAPDGFHAVRDAVCKRYRYVIQDGPNRDVLARDRVWWIKKRLDIHAMREAARFLVGEHDFAAFQGSGSKRISTVRAVHELTVRRESIEPWERVVVEIEANGFLYNMVRNIVGSLMVVGRHAQPPEWIAEVLKTRDRRRAGPTAPPHGLFLVSVTYESGDSPPRTTNW